jgi:hypothetical protein|mmetsp:Transcript_74578/g.124242  ORF Transcript_74578/g.124242 Transcript_74578/m.124242 type:complete len:97 (+) Transcript_74578:86-376(+)
MQHANYTMLRHTVALEMSIVVQAMAPGQKNCRYIAICQETRPWNVALEKKVLQEEHEHGTALGHLRCHAKANIRLISALHSRGRQDPNRAIWCIGR